MKIKLLLCVAMMAWTGQMVAENWKDAEPLKLEVPEMKPELVEVINQPLTYYEQTALTLPRTEAKMDVDFFKSKTNPGVKEYKFMDDMTFVGVPLFLAGIAIKGDKANFRQDYNNTHANTRLITNFKTSIDDYTQMFGPAMTVGLKLAGVEGRSDWPRLLTSSLMSYAWMAAFVNGIKYTAKEMRPDGSTANSWPSGHTATSFVGATILHKEYGLTRSPWYSVAGYGVATATGIMRILNNRHWISDVLSGAGIGILSTELGYAFTDLIFKQKGLLRNDLDDLSDSPSFFSISMGMGLGLKDLEFDQTDYEYTEDGGDIDPIKVDFHTASVVDLEGAYFFNKYIGVGGRLRVRAMTAKSWSDFVQDGYDDAQTIQTIVSLRRFVDLNPNMDAPGWDPTTAVDVPQTEIDVLNNVIKSHEVSIESDHLTEFSANVGLYFNLPLTKSLSMGTKLLIGRSMTQELDINSKMSGNVADVNYTMQIVNGTVDEAATKITGINAKTDANGNPVTYDIEWDYLSMGGNNSTTYGTGISLTYKYKSNFSWKVFADYDYSKKDYTLTYDPMRYMKTALPNAVKFFEGYGIEIDPIKYVKTRKNHFFTIGGSFAVTF
jgi:membrane-associated phospholipid phosphatase